MSLGQSVGAFESPSTGAVDTSLTGEQKLQRSSAIRDYLTDRIAVQQSGRPCLSSLLPLERLLAQGARFRFECPEPVTTLRVSIEALIDLNPAYRTMVTAESPMAPAQALFTATDSSHDLRVTATAGGRPAEVTTVAVGTGIAVAGGLAVLLFRRRLSGRRR